MIFVTGASGFIGRHFVERALSEGQELLVLTRNASKYRNIGSEIVIEGDLGEWQFWENRLKNYEIETCVHLAWEGIPNYSYCNSEKNLFNNLSVLHICENHKIKNLVISGSCWEYMNPYGSVTIECETDFSNPFKAAKNSAHMMSSAFCKEKGIHLNWMRLFYVYGPNQRLGSLIPHIITEFKAGRIPELIGAYNENDFVYVSDVVTAILKVTLCHEFSEVLNVGSGKATRVLDIVKYIAPIYGMEIDDSNYVKSNSKSFYADRDEMKQQYGFEAQIDISTGITNILNRWID